VGKPQVRFCGEFEGVTPHSYPVCVGQRVSKPREMKVLSLLRAVPQKEMNQILQEVTNVIKL